MRFLNPLNRDGGHLWRSCAKLSFTKQEFIVLEKFGSCAADFEFGIFGRRTSSKRRETVTGSFWCSVFLLYTKIYSPENERMSTLKRDYFNRKYIFQPLIFRGHSLVFQWVFYKYFGDERSESTITHNDANKLFGRFDRSERQPIILGI